MFLLHSHILNFGDVVIVLGWWDGWRMIGGWHIPYLTSKVWHRGVCDQDEPSLISIAHKKPSEVSLSPTSLAGPTVPEHTSPETVCHS